LRRGNLFLRDGKAGPGKPLVKWEWPAPAHKAKAVAILDSILGTNLSYTKTIQSVTVG